MVALKKFHCLVAFERFQHLVAYGRFQCLVALKKFHCLVALERFQRLVALERFQCLVALKKFHCLMALERFQRLMALESFQCLVTLKKFHCLVAFERFQCLVALESFQFLVANGRRRRSILITSFHFLPTNFINFFFPINLKVLFYHGFRPLFMHFLPFPWPINYNHTSRCNKSFTHSLRIWLKIEDFFSFLEFMASRMTTSYKPQIA